MPIIRLHTHTPAPADLDAARDEARRYLATRRLPLGCDQQGRHLEARALPEAADDDAGPLSRVEALVFWLAAALGMVAAVAGVAALWPA